ncbi:hypothetical protein BTN33_02930 [Aeromonas veronii]|uniref:hypothetical protein n=1 Tax=Aeromonas veronii TaxID=654 RepID=UPI000946E71F|nr:hypothetical protein [Aeromonas veronii]OLF60506.1 hypothetical protein BTN33_02930 [Aeromonas veronii]
MAVIISILISLPAVIYYIRWGIGLWDRHEDWAIMANYFNGFYGPILTALSIGTIAYQIKATSTSNEVNRLSDDFARLCTNLKNQIIEINPYDLEDVYNEVRLSKTNESEPNLGPLSYPFFINKTQLMHSVIGIDLTLRRLKNIDEKKFKSLRANLFSDINRNIFRQLIHIAIGFKTIPNDDILK